MRRMETGDYMVTTLSDDEAIFTSNDHRAGERKSCASVDVDDDEAVMMLDSAGIRQCPVSRTYNGISDQVVQGGIDSVQSNLGTVQVYSNHAGLHDARVYRVGTNLSYHRQNKNALGEHLTSCGEGWTSCMSADEALQLKLTPCQRCYPTLPGNDVNHAIAPSDQAGTALTITAQSTSHAIDTSGAQNSTDTSLFKYKIGKGKSYHRKLSVNDSVVACGQRGGTAAVRVASLVTMKPCSKCYDALFIEAQNTTNLDTQAIIASNSPIFSPTNTEITSGLVQNTHSGDRNLPQVSNAYPNTGIVGDSFITVHDAASTIFKIGNGNTYHRKVSINDDGVACGTTGSISPIEVTSTGTMKPCSKCYKSSVSTTTSTSNLPIAIETTGVQDVALAKYRIGKGNMYHRKLTIDGKGVACGQRGGKAPVQVTSLGAMKPCSKCYDVSFKESQSTSNPSTQALIASDGTISTLTNIELTSGLVRNTQSSDRNPLQVSNAYPSTRSSTNSREPTGVVGDSSFVNGVMTVQDAASVIYRIENGKSYHRKVSINDDGVACGSTGSTLPIEVTSTGTMKPCSKCYPSSVSTTTSTTYPNTRAHSTRAAAISASTVERVDQSVQVHVPVLPEWTDSYPNTRSRQATRATVVNTENIQVTVNSSGRNVVVPNTAEARYKIGNGKKYHRKVDSDASGVACGQKGTTPPSLISSVDAMTPCAKCYK
ncbi:hypothetical protein SARC_06371 [Sphaeroforma arctica JP610]|uniref:Uncharacterized protein n=1 Tax=Sphaeroforma arctica JP610 TaxID=667725 RepID=A0A0L0FXL2_9EUKA|nr:hypothetical protein SARC_06371 [Sphaeroforma arctica JP610]KNC81301.1 hypothetical protein SARC_06371 [Sphaeroforma arctica JP610]|eukprot:XP_014155203.1 hypothetical protein SARC_06371 [Sphaeroforma arctica JP610]